MVEGSLPFPMLSDPAGKIGELYGVYSTSAGVDIRGRFLIDPDGIIQSMEVLTPPVGRSVEEMLRQIRAYQLVREPEGIVCPASWQPGEPTLKPRTDLVGNVWKEWKPKKIV